MGNTLTCMICGIIETAPSLQAPADLLVSGAAGLMLIECIDRPAIAVLSELCPKHTESCRVLGVARHTDSGAPS